MTRDSQLRPIQRFHKRQGNVQGRALGHAVSHLEMAGHD